MYLEFLASLCLLILFLGSGISKIMNFNSVAKCSKQNHCLICTQTSYTISTCMCYYTFSSGSLVLLYLVFTKLLKNRTTQMPV